MMTSLLDNPAFQADLRALAGVTMNPERHTAPNVLEHTLAVVRRVEALAKRNGCSVDEMDFLRLVGYAHDIGKIGGTANPLASVERLSSYGITDARFLDFVRYHDAPLQWHRSTRRREPPTDHAWRKLTERVDVRLLCLFIVADRVDAPAGWRGNEPTTWFLDEVRRRGIVTGEMVLDVEDQETASALTPMNGCSGRERDP